MTPFNLIATARALADTGRRGRPRQTDLRRAVSTAYYALFHCLAACCADLLVGGSGADRSATAWERTYRALEHGVARQRCRAATTTRDFPPSLRHFAAVFVDMQGKRHQADYAATGNFPKHIVLQDISGVAEAIAKFQQVPARDRRAFAVYLLLNLRNN